MNKRQYNALLDELKTFPVPGTKLYPPLGCEEGLKLLRYEVAKDQIWAVVATDVAEIKYTLDQVSMCKFNKR